MCRSYCSRGKKICQGQPCVTATLTTPTVPIIPATPAVATKPGPSPLLRCRTGWSQWFNSHHPQKGADAFDVQPIPSSSDAVLSPVPEGSSAAVDSLPGCAREMMVDIECRTVGTQVSHRKTGDQVECSLERGLDCRPGGIKGRSLCYDYEIRVLCDCGAKRRCFILI